MITRAQAETMMLLLVGTTEIHQVDLDHPQWDRAQDLWQEIQHQLQSERRQNGQKS